MLLLSQHVIIHSLIDPIPSIQPAVKWTLKELDRSVPIKLHKWQRQAKAYFARVHSFSLPKNNSFKKSSSLTRKIDLTSPRLVTFSLLYIFYCWGLCRMKQQKTIQYIPLTDQAGNKVWGLWLAQEQQRMNNKNGVAAALIPPPTPSYESRSTSPLYTLESHSN